MFQMHLQSSLHLFPTVPVSDPQTATLQIQRFIGFFFIAKRRLFKPSLMGSEDITYLLHGAESFLRS